MKISSRLLLPALLLGSPVTFAQAPEPQAPAAATAPSKTISVTFRGSLRDAIKKIAEQGGLNVIVTGELNTPAEVHLQGITAEQALRTLARSYSLRLDNDGSIFTLRPQTAGEKQAAAQETEAKVIILQPSAPAAPAVVPAPPAPPVPPMVADVPEMVDAEDFKERIRERLKEVRRHRRGGKDVVARGHNLEVREGESVDTAVVYGGNLIVKGHVEDDAVAFGGNLEVSGVVQGDAHAFGGNVILRPGAVVEGDVSSFGGMVERSEGAHVEGSTESFGGANIARMVAGEVKAGLKEAREELRKESSGAASNVGSDDDDRGRDRDGFSFPSLLLWFAALFGVGFLAQVIFPARMKDLGTEIRTQPVLSGVAGVLGMLALIPLTIILIATLIGIPVAAALWCVVMPLTAALGIAALAGEVGMKLPIMRGKKTQAMVLALGLGVLLLLSEVPFLGPVLFCLATLVGFGAVIRTRFGIRPKGVPEPLFRSSEPV
ncbi:hypothetical protein P2318_17850 [Myxococcaceae bacterium GXIMD 01537]